METLWNISIDVCFGLIGILLWNLFKSRNYIYKTKLLLYFRRYYKGMVHSIIFILVISIILNFIPEINTDINNIFGIDIIANNKKSFIIFGVTLSMFYS